MPKSDSGMSAAKSNALEAAMTKVSNDLENMLDLLLPKSNDPEGRLFEAMRYVTFAGGKRFRPFLVVQGAALFDVEGEAALRTAAAVEMIHTYSLVHDDLPCMDDDDLRRGKPTAHIQFDEATAVLAGDALLTMAFEILAAPETHANARIRAELVLELARAAGAHGMVGGQMIDIVSQHTQSDIGSITRLQQLKTGALITFSAEAGAILGGAGKAQRHALHAYAHDLGLAFQIADDLLDYAGNEEELGKAVGKDEEQGKATFVSLMGYERAKTQAHMLAEQAIQHLDIFNENADLLRTVAEFVVKRRR